MASGQIIVVISSTICNKEGRTLVNIYQQSLVGTMKAGRTTAKV